MNRRIYYSSLFIAAIGSLALWFIKKPHLITGWWIGILIGLINFSALLSSLEKTRQSASAPTAVSGVTGKFQKSFFVRYLLLAGAFFLVIQMGKEQLGSAVLGFLSLYLSLFVDYFIRAKTRKNS